MGETAVWLLHLCDESLKVDHYIVPSHLDGVITPQSAYYCFGVAVCFGLYIGPVISQTHSIEHDQTWKWHEIIYCDVINLTLFVNLVLGKLFLVLHVVHSVIIWYYYGFAHNNALYPSLQSSTYPLTQLLEYVNWSHCHWHSLLCVWWIMQLFFHGRWLEWHRHWKGLLLVGKQYNLSHLPQCYRTVNFECEWPLSNGREKSDLFHLHSWNTTKMVVVGSI